MRLRVVVETDPGGLVRLQQGGFEVEAVEVAPGWRLRSQAEKEARDWIVNGPDRRAAVDLPIRNQREGSDPARTTGAPGPSPADVPHAASREDAGPSRGSVPETSSQVLPSAPSAVAPAAAKVPSLVPADPAFAARGDAPAAWRTPEREMRLRALWTDPAWSRGAIWRALSGMTGPLMSGLSAANLTHWAAKLELGARPELIRPQAEAIRMENLRRGKAAAQRRAESAEDEAGPVALLPAGEIRETPQLARAREMLGMGLHPNDIKMAVKLSAVEMQAIRDAHAEAAA